MKNKTKIVILTLSIVFLVICEIYLFIEMQNKSKQMIEIDLKRFEPFSQGNVLKNYETSFKIEENLPKIEAASAFYPFAANLVQNIYSKDSYSKDDLKLVSTSQAYTDIINGKADIIIATCPSDEQKLEIFNSNLNLEFKKLYLEPLAIIVNSENNTKKLMIEDIQNIYHNNNLNWNTYQLEKNNGSQTCFENIVKNNTIGDNHSELKLMPEIIDKIALDKKGVGYTFYSYYSKMHTNKNVKIIDINDKKIEDIDYPMLYEVYLIYKTDSSNENISKIVNWLDTEEGQKIIDSIK